MLECLVLGDSIASGVGHARPECETTARVGITSGAYLNDLFPLASRTARTAVISLGVNDDISVDTIDNLRRVRRSLNVPSVVWLLPGLKDNVREIIRTVARENGDQLVDTRPYVGGDHLHPSGAGYRIIADQTLAPGDTQVASFEEPTRPLAGRQRMTTTSFPLAGNLSQYRVTYVLRGSHTGGRVQEMSDLRHLLAHREATGRPIYGIWPPPHVTYGALPPPSYAYGAFNPIVIHR